MTIEATKASKSAIETIEKHGGTFKSVYIDPEILKCWAGFKTVSNQIEFAYDPLTKIPCIFVYYFEFYRQNKSNNC